MPLNYPVLYRSIDIRSEAVVSAAVQQAIADAESLWAPEKFDGVFPTKGFGIKRLQPRDLVSNSGSIVCANGNSTWGLSIGATSTWQTWISAGVLSDSVYGIITGFFNYDTAPDIDVIKFVADGIEYATYDLQEAWGWDVATAFFSHPIVIRPEKMLTIRVKSSGGAGIKRMGLLGYALAKRSYLIGEL
jgi:hypothetical protein